MEQDHLKAHIGYVNSISNHLSLVLTLFHRKQVSLHIVEDAWGPAPEAPVQTEEIATAQDDVATLYLVWTAGLRKPQPLPK